MMSKKKGTLLQLEKLLSLPVLILKQSGRWLTKHQSHAIEHLPAKEELICRVFKRCVTLLFLAKRSPLFRRKILSMLEYPLKSKWTIFLDKLSSSEDQSMLSMYLFKTLVQELTLRERAYKPFWTPAYKELSEKLSLPTEIDCADLDSTSSNLWSPRQEERLPFLTVKTRRLVNKNSLKTCCPSFTSSPVDRWEDGAIKQKTVKIQIFPTSAQKEILDEFISTSRYVYNMAVEKVKQGHKDNFMSLRDLLVTQNTKKNHDEIKEITDNIKKLMNTITADNKNEILAKIKVLAVTSKQKMVNLDYVRNPQVKDFELRTPKDVRACSVKSVCDAIKAGKTNLRDGNIKSFSIKYKRKTTPHQAIELTPAGISMKEGIIRISPHTFVGNCTLKISKRNKKKHKKLEINHNVDIIKKNGKFYICILTNATLKTKNKTDCKTRVCGVDPGVRTLATVYSVADCELSTTEYTHREDLLHKLNEKIDKIKSTRKLYNVEIKVTRKNKRRRKITRRKSYCKIETKKTNIVDSLHWAFINHLLARNDVIYFGDIKSHDILKGSKNRRLNRSLSDLKLYELKQRLVYKASLFRGKKVYLLDESYTTKTCSTCGTINYTVGCSKVFSCPRCSFINGRDLNASKNILMKGILT